MACSVPWAFSQFFDNINLTVDHHEIAKARRDRVVSILRRDFDVLGRYADWFDTEIYSHQRRVAFSMCLSCFTTANILKEKSHHRFFPQLEKHWQNIEPNCAVMDKLSLFSMRHGLMSMSSPWPDA